jgi:pimeloyl-ACP methyl ester carboxylesterase
MVCALQDVPEVSSGGYVTTKVIRLRDGRRLAYSEVGDPDGLPVFHQHDMPGSRLEHEAEPDLYRSLGVRVITPDRPGYGLSDPHLHRPLLDWPSDRWRTSAFRCSCGMGTRTLSSPYITADTLHPSSAARR